MLTMIFLGGVGMGVAIGVIGVYLFCNVDEATCERRGIDSEIDRVGH